MAGAAPRSPWRPNSTRLAPRHHRHDRQQHSGPALDLADQDSVRPSSPDGRPLHILVNNAGIMATPQTHTPEVCSSHQPLRHFASPPASTTPSKCRVVSVSSAAPPGSPIISTTSFPSTRTTSGGRIRHRRQRTCCWASKQASAGSRRITANALNARPDQQRHPAASRHRRPRAPAGGRSVPDDKYYKTPRARRRDRPCSWHLTVLEGVGGRYFRGLQEAGAHRPGAETA